MDRCLQSSDKLCEEWRRCLGSAQRGDACALGGPRIAGEVGAGNALKIARGADVARDKLCDDPDETLDGDEVVLVKLGGRESRLELSGELGESGVDDARADTVENAVGKVEDGDVEEGIVDVGRVDVCDEICHGGRVHGVLGADTVADLDVELAVRRKVLDGHADRVAEQVGAVSNAREGERAEGAVGDIDGEADDLSGRGGGGVAVGDGREPLDRAEGTGDGGIKHAPTKGLREGRAGPRGGCVAGQGRGRDERDDGKEDDDEGEGVVWGHLRWLRWLQWLQLQFGGFAS